MVVGNPGSLLGQSELPVPREPANQKTKPMSPERKSEEECRCEPPAEEVERDSVSSEGGRVTDSTDEEESSSTESVPAQEKAVGNEVQRCLEAKQLKVMAHISKLEQSLRELQLQRRELNIEVEMEVALLEGELRTEKKEMEKEENLIRSLHEKLRETERKWQEEKDKDKLKLRDEKKKIKDLEQKISEGKSQLEKQPESLREQLRKNIQEMTETMEAAVKSFEDLEFQQLESESSRDEERESSYRQISQDISKRQNELNRRKDKVLRLEEHIQGAEDQAQVERQRLSEENTRVFQSLNKEKDQLESLNALSGKDQGQNEKPQSSTRKALQRTNSLPKRRASAPFVRPTDRPLSLHGNTCLESAGLALHLAVSSNNTGGQIALAISPNLQITQARLPQVDDRKGSNREKIPSDISTLQLSYGPLPKIAEIERQLREALAEKERLLKAREEKRAAKEMTRRLESSQNQVKTEEPAPVTAKPALPETKGEPEKVLSVLRAPAPLDLRSHLEASGHCVETCPHVRVSPTCCKGYLVKMGGRIKTWRKRWFVFDRQKRRLAYYTDKDEVKLKGVIYFQAIEEVYYDHLRSAFKSPHPKLTFCLKTFERLFCMVAPTPEAMRIWMDVMVTAAEENSRY
ncbi:pleckstrin homology-like domain family B member 3 isoform X2 [Xenopus tropicalis]|uniref:Pleckstrin homology-like domain family B member 3 isoform X2 n=1 Tax=Xenopus tropicalis TaxID=8364 RepID=F6SLA9_XENTR|nr:pleckstrin homology-like domain family B member 3 isoform X2 [Xenopus tropicalis]|eukprot:XP_004916448.1 PREDICTED: pleckstrin homology-like domain family B member 3 isoform X2 [Xenopus tropicalis]